MRVKITSRRMSTSAGMRSNEEIVDLPEDEVTKILKMRPDALQILEPEQPVFQSAKPKKRARNANGTLKGDDKSTPDVNEAWENG